MGIAKIAGSLTFLQFLGFWTVAWSVRSEHLPGLFSALESEAWVFWVLTGLLGGVLPALVWMLTRTRPISRSQGWIALSLLYLTFFIAVLRDAYWASQVSPSFEVFQLAGMIAILLSAISVGLNAWNIVVHRMTKR